VPTQAQIESDIRHSIEDERERNPVDPTQNVRQIIWQESKYQKGMLDAESRYSKGIRQAEIRRLEELAWAETRRVNDLEAQRVRYETRIAEDLKVNVKTTSDQLAGQLVKETAALYNQVTALSNSLTNQISALTQSIPIQISTISTGFSTRLSALEQFRWETGGKSAIADPALSAALVEMTQSIAKLKDTSSMSGGREVEKDVTRKDNTLVVSIIVSVVGGLSLIASIVIGVVTIFLTHH
jgi:hypothetical protein